MGIEVLVAAMNKKDTSLYQIMNIDVDMIIANQSDYNAYEEVNINGKSIKMITTNDRGVGKNRNKAIHFSSKDILVFSDEDLVYHDNVFSQIEKAYKELSDADAILFQVNTNRKDLSAQVQKCRRVNRFNYARYGAVRLSVKRNTILRFNCKFNELFGGGCIYSAGEDNNFIHDLIKNKAIIYTYPLLIASESDRQSTWFTGYNEKYFYDSGALMSAIYGKWKYIMSFVFLLKRNHNKDLSFKQKLKFYFIGAKNYKNLISYEEWVCSKK